MIQEKFAGTLKPGIQDEFKAWAYQSKATIGAKDQQLADAMDEIQQKHIMQGPVEYNARAKQLIDTIGLEKDKILHSILLNLTVLDSELFKILQTHHGRG